MSNSNDENREAPNATGERRPTMSGGNRGMLVAMAIGLASIALLVAVQLMRMR